MIKFSCDILAEDKELSWDRDFICTMSLPINWTWLSRVLFQWGENGNYAVRTVGFSLVNCLMVDSFVIP